MTNKATEMKFGEIVEVDRSLSYLRQRIETENGEIVWLTGVDRCRGGEVGDRVKLVYRASGSAGLWFASHDETLSCTCGRPSEDGETCIECIVDASQS